MLSTASRRLACGSRPAGISSDRRTAVKPELAMQPIQHPREDQSNADRAAIVAVEPKTLRTYTPSQAVIAKSAGPSHWTPEGRRLYDFSSGVLVANLGHNPTSWMQRFAKY